MAVFGTPTGGIWTTRTIVENDVTNLVTDLAAKAPLASPSFTGTPTTPTANAGSNTAQVANTQFVMNQLSSAVFLGRIFGQVSTTIAGTTRTNVGTESNALSNATVTNVDDADGPFQKLTDNTGGTDGFGITTGANVKLNWGIAAGTVFKTPNSLTDLRLVIGLFEQGLGATVTYDSALNTAKGIALRYDSTIPDSTWKVITSSGLTATGTYDTGVTVSASTYYRTMFIGSSGTMDIWLQTGITGVLNKVLTVNDVTKMPPSTQLMEFNIFGLAPAGGLNRNISFSSIHKIRGIGSSGLINGI